MPLSNTGFKGIWVDDERPLPEGYAEAGWTASRSFHEAITKLELIEFDEVSLDHDLGEGSKYGTKEMSGYDVLMWLIYRREYGMYTPSTVHIHTANWARRPMMEALVEKYWDENYDPFAEFRKEDEND